MKFSTDKDRRAEKGATKNQYVKFKNFIQNELNIKNNSINNETVLLFDKFYFIIIQNLIKSSLKIFNYLKYIDSSIC